MVVMPELAPLVALAMLVTAGSIGLGVVLTVFFWKTHRSVWAKWSIAATAVLAVVYGLGWMGSSLASNEIVLRQGEKKYLCELDCRLAYAVTNVSRTATSATDVIWDVTVTVVFDDKTISSSRGNETPLWPNPRVILVEDEQGRTYHDMVSERSQPWNRSLRPGESFSFDLSFELPADVSSPRLLISTGTFVDPFMIGHERSPLHKKIWFALEPTA